MADGHHYEVGYRKPPKAFQFQKGRSGNASGRPRKVPGIAEVLWQLANERVLIHGKDGPKYTNMLKAMFTQVRNKGVTGDLKAVRQFVEMLVQFPLPGATQKDMEATSSSAKAKLLVLLKARNNFLAEGAAKSDQISDPPNAPHQCTGRREPREKSSRRQPPFPSVGEHDSAGPLDHRLGLNSRSQPPPASPVPDGGGDPSP
jgi:hypothetical protein